MIVRLVLEDEYYGAFPEARNVFGSKAFHSVTRVNAEAVRYFIGTDDGTKPRLGIVAGYKGGEWYAPYSSPFTEIAYRKPQHLEHIYDFISELTDMLGAPLHITLPPDFYDPVMLPKICGILSNYAQKTMMDFDYYYPTARADRYREHLDHSARKNLAQALTAGFSFAATDDIERAYAVIRANRESHGYPLAMSLQQVCDTVQVVKADFFILTLDGQDVAAAMVYHVADGIVQVVYWGDAPGYSHLRPMNILPYKIFSHYKDMGISTVDVGPSSTAGIPNSGLCRFKESIGCMTALRPSFVF